MGSKIQKISEAPSYGHMDIHNISYDEIPQILEAGRKQKQLLEKQIKDLTAKKANQQRKTQTAELRLEKKEDRLNELGQTEAKLARDMKSCQQQVQKLIFSRELLEKQRSQLQEQCKRSESGQQVKYEKKKLELESQNKQKTAQIQRIAMNCYNLQIQISKAQQKCRSDEKGYQTIINGNKLKDKQIDLLLTEIHQLQEKISFFMNNYLVVLRINGGKEIEIQLQGQRTISDLKQLIYQNYYQKVLPQLIVLLENNRPLRADQKLMQVFTHKKAKLVLRKAEVWEIQELKTDKQGVDQILGEKGVAYLKCGHYYSRSSMRGLIDFQVTRKKQHQITCPALVDELLCNQKFAKLECQLIGGYKQDEWGSIQSKMKQNYIMTRRK